jgi:hypothetical protein
MYPDSWATYYERICWGSRGSRALARACRQVRAGSRITIELVPKGAAEPGALPVICAVELAEEEPAGRVAP